MTLTLILFLIMDPMGNVGAFNATLQQVPASRRFFVKCRELLFALLTMMVFNVLGEYIFDALQLQELTVRFASGIIIFLIALRMLFPGDDRLERFPEGEPFVVPLAIPLVAGPSILGTILLYGHIVPGLAKMSLAIFIAWVGAASLILIGPQLERALGKNGLTAFERLMGLLLILLATQRFMEGVKLLIQQYA